MANKTTKMEAEVRKAYDIKPKDGEAYQDFHKRLATAIDADDKKGGDVWDALTNTTQKFLNDAATLLRKGEDVPAFPADDEAAEAPKAKTKTKDEDEEEDGGDGAAEEGSAKPKKGASMKTDKKKAEKKTAVAKPKDKGTKPVTGKDKGAKPVKPEKIAKKDAGEKKASTAGKKNKAEKGKSATLRIWELMHQNPNKTSEQIGEALKKEGFKASDSTVVAYRHEFLRYHRFATGKGVKGLTKVDGAEDKKQNKKSATIAVLNAVFSKPERSSEDVAAIVKKEGHKVSLSTVSTFRIGLLRWLRLMKSKGVKGIPEVE